MDLQFGFDQEACQLAELFCGGGAGWLRLLGDDAFSVFFSLCIDVVDT